MKGLQKGGRVFFILALILGSWGCSKCSTDHVKSMEFNNTGVEYFRRKLFSQAIRDLSKAVSIDPNNEEAHFNLSLVYMETKQWQPAAEHLKKAISLNSEDPMYYYKLGMCYQELNQLEEAKRQYQKAIELDKNLYKAHYRLGSVLQAQYMEGKLPDLHLLAQKALQKYTDAINLNPRFGMGYNKLGMFYADLGFLDHSLQVLRIGAEINPRDAQIHNSLGTVYQQKRMLQEAVFAFRKSLEIDPTLCTAIYNLGMTYVELKQKENARLYLEKFTNMCGQKARPDYVKAASDRLFEIITGEEVR
jgi:tetratricopeptide (TPR) repeat protein